MRMRGRVQWVKVWLLPSSPVFQKLLSEQFPLGDGLSFYSTWLLIYSFTHHQVLASLHQLVYSCGVNQ